MKKCSIILLALIFFALDACQQTFVEDQSCTFLNLIELMDATTPQPGSSTGIEHGDTTNSEPGDTTTPEPGDTTSSEPGDTTSSEPGDTTGSEPGDTTTPEPGDTTSSEPGDTTSSEPGDTTTPEPGDTSKGESIVFIQISLANDSPQGTFLEDTAYEVYKFNVSADQGDFFFSNAIFEVTNFNGNFNDCSLWEGNTLISDKSAYHADTSNLIIFDEDAPWEAQRILIGIQPKTFSLVCRVEIYSSPQTLSVRYRAGLLEIGPSGRIPYLNSSSDGPWGNDLTFQWNKLYSWLTANNPAEIIASNFNPTVIMEFQLATSAGEAKLFSLPFTILNAPANSFTGCYLWEPEGARYSRFVDLNYSDQNNFNVTFYYGPKDGVYPGEEYTFMVVDTTPKTFRLCCWVDEGKSNYTTTIQLHDVYYYQTDSDLYYDIEPDSDPIIETSVTPRW